MTSVYDAEILLPGLKLVRGGSADVPDDVQGLTKDGSILVFLKQFGGDLGSALGNQKMWVRAMYERGGKPLNRVELDGDAKKRGGKPSDGAGDGEKEKEEKAAARDDEEESDGDGEGPGGDVNDSWEELDDEFEDLNLEPLVQKWEGKSCVHFFKLS